jgi:hypothetical protein
MVSTSCGLAAKVALTPQPCRTCAGSSTVWLGATTDEWHHVARLVPDEVGAAAIRWGSGEGARSQTNVRRALARVQGLLGVDAVSLPECGGRSPGACARAVGLAERTDDGAAPDAPGQGVCHRCLLLSMRRGAPPTCATGTASLSS